MTIPDKEARGTLLKAPTHQKGKLFRTRKDDQGERGVVKVECFLDEQRGEIPQSSAGEHIGRIVGSRFDPCPCTPNGGNLPHGDDGSREEIEGSG